jgi:lipocalin
VGSTKPDGEYQVVQDDFQLICWDFVSEPSTPGAFMMAEGVNIDRRDLDRYFTRSDRIDRIFNDILDWEEK